MKKLILKVTGAQAVNKHAQKSYKGGLLTPTRGNCNGRPSGSRCYYGGHSGCPGECDGNGNCIPY
ncbi:MAG: hypothetical protein AAGG75_25930 [Bacteroidota bacterium]